MDRDAVWPKLLLDLRAARYSTDVRMSHTGVLIDFAEEILAIDQLKPAPPQVREGKSKSSEFNLLSVSHESDYFRVVQAPSVGETLPDAINRPRPRNDKLHFCKVSDLAVVEVGDILIG